MTLSRGRHQPKMSTWTTGKSSGWTAFHQKQLQGQDVGIKSEVDVYPPLVSSRSSTPPFGSGTVVSCSSENNKALKNEFCGYMLGEHSATSSLSNNEAWNEKSSLIASPLIDRSNDGARNPARRRHISNGTIRCMATEDKKAVQKIEKLKQANSWADDRLIEDILAAVNDNEDQASTILRSMYLSTEPLSTDKENRSSKMNIGNHEEGNRVQSIGQLKKIHSWADDVLIEDILVAVGGNKDEASLILVSICPTESEAEDFGDNYGDTTISGGSRQPKRSAWPTGRSSGWTAFHQQQLQGHNMLTKSKLDVYPPPLSSSQSHPPSRSGTLFRCSSENQKSDKNGFCDYKLREFPATSSFSSVVRSSLAAMPSIDHSNTGAVDTSAEHESNGTTASMVTKEKKPVEKVVELKQANDWADNSLIEDILAAVHNNEAQASMILRSMDLSAHPLSTSKENINGKSNITSHEERNRAESIERLKEKYVWADDALIEDILVAVGGNEDQASLILTSMCPIETEADDFGDNRGETILSVGPCQPKMSAWSARRCSGWTAFHGKQLQGHNMGNKSKVDMYAPFPGTSSSTLSSWSGTLAPCSSKNQKSDKSGFCEHKESKYPSTNSLSSVVKNSSVSMPLIGHSNNGIIDIFSNKQMATEEKKRAQKIEKLRQVNRWADDTLIEDILAAVDNNEDRASMILTSMDFSANHLSMEEDNSHNKMNITGNEERNGAESIGQLKKLHTWADDALLEDILSAVGDNEDEASLLLLSMCPTGSSEADVAAKRVEFDISSVKNLKETNKVTIDLYKRKTPSVEPEWEHDDIYSRHRKDAIRMMRLASLHSRGARNAFSRGDHVHARQLSQRAREEWLAAEKLNQEAAKEILHFRNKGNDIWKLDLHGLHASEAVQAVQAHLGSIESLLMTGDSVCSGKLINGNGSLQGLSAECTQSSDRGEAPEKPRLPIRSSRPQRQTMLEVITGTGKHSRGNAALPAAVRSFLLTNGYHFYDARPGVISVRPKFRHS
ncbi:unnamed protein product [Victoria cruziana]